MENKTETIQIRLTKDEKEKIKLNASLLSVTVSEYIMRTIKRKRLVVFEEFSGILYQLSKIGNNINQIAHTANSNKIVTENQINEIKTQLDKTVNLFSQVLNLIIEKETNTPKELTDKSPEDILYEIYKSTKRIERRLGKTKSKTS